MAIKGQKFQHYPVSVKSEAIRLHVEEKWTYRKITQHLGNHDTDRVKKWQNIVEKVSVYLKIVGETHFVRKRRNTAI